MTDDIEQRIEEIRVRLEAFRRIDPHAEEWQYAYSTEVFQDESPADIDWLVHQLTESRQECERLRAACETAVVDLEDSISWNDVKDIIAELKAAMSGAPPPSSAEHP